MIKVKITLFSASLQAVCTEKEPLTDGNQYFLNII